MKHSLGHTLKTKVAPVAFLVALTFLTVRTCQTELAEVHFSFDLGAGADEVRSFRVDVFRAGEDVSVAFLERADMGGVDRRDIRMEAQLDTGTYLLAFEVETRDGTRHFTRQVETTDRARITLNLERDLASPDP